MFRFTRSLQALSSSRSAATATVSKTCPTSSPNILISEEGVHLASIAVPCPWNGLSRVSIVFNAGSRNELDSKDHGITHLIRRSCGLSTSEFTAVNLTRHIQQMGARITCSTTREHMIYTVDAAPNLISRAGYLLAEMATRAAYYEWELKAIANKLMRTDVELLHRRNLPALSIELLHEAAFGQNPSGSGLGVSLLAPADRVGSYSIEQIEQFHQHFFTPSNCAMSLIGHGIETNGVDLLREIKAGLNFRAPQKVPEKTGKVHGFIGGDVRRDLAAASAVYANLAWPTLGKGSPQQLAFDLAACSLTGSTGRVSSGGRALTNFGGIPEVDDVQISAFHKAYDGHGLFGVSLCGPDANTVGDRLAQVVHTMRSVKFTSEELAKAKTILKTTILMELESPMNIATDLALQISNPTHSYQTPEKRVAAVDTVSLSQVNDAISQSVGSSRAALSVVGPGAFEILPLSVLLSA